jgi:Zn-dependent protease with chaperone function
MRVEHIAATVCALLATYLIHSTLLLGAAWLTTRKLPSRLDSLSEIIWRVALGLPIATTLLRELLASTAVVNARSVGVIEYTPQAFAIGLVPDWMWIGVAMLWLLGALAGLAHLFYCYARLRLAIAHRSVLSRPESELVSDVIGRSAVRLSVVADQTLPFALSSEICLPRWMLHRMSAAELRAVVAHELAHVRRHDALWRIATAAVRRCFFFQPLNWIAVERLRELSECICDDEAVAATRSRLPLAAALETVARRARRHHAQLALAPAMGAPVSLTVKRVERILFVTESVRSAEIRPLYRAGGMVLAAAMGLWLAPSVSLPATAFLRYTINGEDPAGRFTITLDKGRVVGATMGGRLLEPREVRQSAETVVLLDQSESLSLRMTPEGGIKWNARKPASSASKNRQSM